MLLYTRSNTPHSILGPSVSNIRKVLPRSWSHLDTPSPLPLLLLIHLETMASVSRIVQLAHQISESVARIDKVLTVKGIPTPSFDEDAPLLSLPEQVRDDQDIVIDAAMELHDLLINPVQLIKAQAGVRSSPLGQPRARLTL